MTEISEITSEDREKIKAYIDKSPYVTHEMVARRFKMSKSKWSLIINGKNTSPEATEVIDAVLTMYGLR